MRAVAALVDLMRKTYVFIGALALGVAANAGFAQGAGEVITKQYSDGSVYEGTFVNGQPDGTGTYRLTNGYEYTGDWKAGQIIGQGVAHYPNGSVYEGAFVDSKPQGKGKIAFAGGGSYEGDWLAGAITGTGRQV